MIGKLKNIVQFKLQQEKKRKDNQKKEEQDILSEKKTKKKKFSLEMDEEEIQESTEKEKITSGIRVESAVAAESTDIMIFNQAIYEKVLLVVMENELHNRIMVLNRLHLFEKADPMLLSPLASFLTTEEYKMGETIIYAN